jgi:YVTN family beta-propeller protein
MAEAHGLAIVNTQTNDVAEFLLLGMAPTAGVLASDNSVFYVSDSMAGHVVPIAIDQRRVARPIQVGQRPGQLALTPGDDMLLVVDSQSNDLAVVRTATSGLITLIPVGQRPRDIAIKMF